MVPTDPDKAVYDVLTKIPFSMHVKSILSLSNFLLCSGPTDHILSSAESQQLDPLPKFAPAVLLFSDQYDSI